MLNKFPYLNFPELKVIKGNITTKEQDIYFKNYKRDKFKSLYDEKYF